MNIRSIEIDQRSLRRAWVQDVGRIGFTFKLDSDKAPLPMTAEVVEIARGTTESLRLAGNQSPASAESWMRTQTGWAAVLWNVGTWEDATAWFDGFAASWNGIPGLIRGGPSRSMPRWTSKDTLRDTRELAVFAAYTTEDFSTYEGYEWLALWGVDRRFTQALADQVSNWIHITGSSTHLEFYGGIEIADADVGNPLADLLNRNQHAYVLSSREATRSLRWAGFQNNGRALFQTVDPQTSPLERIEKLREMMVWGSQRIDLSFVRYSGTTGTWLGPFVPDFPDVSESDIYRNRQLLAQYTPDACGIQILTDAHLSRANDLSDWLIEPLAGGRHLVQAKDLEAWYVDPEPDPALLAKAREDFGDLIMTAETIKAHLPRGANG